MDSEEFPGHRPACFPDNSDKAITHIAVLQVLTHSALTAPREDRLLLSPFYRGGN